MGEKKRRDQKEICPPEADPPLVENLSKEREERFTQKATKETKGEDVDF